jgi:hypothetical protein
MKKQQVDKVIADIWTSFAQETFPLGPHNEGATLSSMNISPQKQLSIHRPELCGCTY